MLKFTLRIQEVKNKFKKNKLTDKPASFVKLPPPILAKTPKEINEISKFFKKNSQPKDKSDNRKLYAQALASFTNIKKILKIKETFPNLHAKKIENIQKVINNNGKLKPKLNMTMKDSLRKQVIVSISNENKIKFIKSSSTHIMNFNRVLTGIKLEVMAEFVHSDQAGIIIVTNKVSSSLNLQTIKKYVKNSNYIDAKKVKVPCLPQSKLYLKIIDIPYMIENTNTLISANVIETIIKNNYIFNNIVIALKSHIIKVSLKSNIAIIWLDIWDIQSSSYTRGLINRCFNIERYIATIRGINMNSGVLQYKNYWKWGHVTFLCRVQGSKYIKCNSSYKTKN